MQLLSHASFVGQTLNNQSTLEEGWEEEVLNKGFSTFNFSKIVTMKVKNAWQFDLIDSDC